MSEQFYWVAVAHPYDEDTEADVFNILFRSALEGRKYLAEVKSNNGSAWEFVRVRLPETLGAPPRARLVYMVKCQLLCFSGLDDQRKYDLRYGVDQCKESTWPDGTDCQAQITWWNLPSQSTSTYQYQDDQSFVLATCQGQSINSFQAARRALLAQLQREGAERSLDLSKLTV